MMMTLLLAGFLALQGSSQEDPVERQVQRLKDQLQLTDEQTAKVRDVIKKQQDDIRGVLTDEQKKQYEENLRSWGNRRGFGGPGGQGGTPGQGGSGGGTSGGRGSWWPSTDELKTQLSLTDEQATKINEIRDSIRQELRNFWQNRQGGGNPNQDWGTFLQKLRDDNTQKIRDLLSDEQKAKFDEVAKAFPPTESGGGGGGNNGRGRRSSSPEERVTRAMDELKIENADEAQAIKTLVAKVAELMEKAETHLDQSRTKMEEASRNSELSDAAVADKIAEIRKGYQEIEKQLIEARKELTEVVTPRQELALIRRGILSDRR